jgi:hypothetical protein
MIISAKLHFNSKAERICCSCNQIIRIPYLRLYGCAKTGDPKYSLFKCIKCEIVNEVYGELLKLSREDQATIQMYADQHCYELGIV